MLDDQIIKLLGDQIAAVGQKVDDYHSEVKAEISTQREVTATLETEVKLERRRIDRLETNQKVLRVWGLVALFAGGAGGTVISNLLL